MWLAGREAYASVSTSKASAGVWLRVRKPAHSRKDQGAGLSHHLRPPFMGGLVRTGGARITLHLDTGEDLGFLAGLVRTGGARPSGSRSADHRRLGVGAHRVRGRRWYGVTPGGNPARPSHGAGTLVDLPPTVCSSRGAGVADRVALAAQSFLDPPPTVADLYLLKSVRADRPDREGTAILSAAPRRPAPPVVSLSGKACHGTRAGSRRGPCR